jgi:hypothetical protein
MLAELPFALWSLCIPFALYFILSWKRAYAKGILASNGTLSGCICTYLEYFRPPSCYEGTLNRKDDYT